MSSPLLTASTERLAKAIIRHCADVANLPEWMQVPALGRDMWPLAQGIALALIDSGAVVPAESVADNDALMDAAMRGAWSGDPHKNDRALVQQALYALAAALEDQATRP